MRKFILGWILVLYSLVSVAQDLAEGWYVFKLETSTANVDVNSGTNTILNCNEEYQQNTTNFYPLKYAAYDESKAPVAWLYVTKGTTMYQIQSINGHTLNENCTANRSQSNAVVPIAANGDYYRIGTSPGSWTDYANTGAETPYVGRGNRSAKDFSITPVTAEQIEGYDIYTVRIIGAVNAAEIGNDVRVTCTNENNKGIANVYNNGYFFLPVGTEVSVSDFTAPEQVHYRLEITIADKVITVEYHLLVRESLQEAVNAAKPILEKKGIGCPLENGMERSALQLALTEAETALAEGGTPTEQHVSALNEALSSYISTTNVQLPEDGKAYTFTGVMKNGVRRYMNYTEAGYELAETTDADNSNYPETAKLVCHQVSSDANSNTYVFTNNAGKYFIWKGGVEGYNENKGYSDEYAVATGDVPYCLLKVGKLLNGGHVSAEGNADLMGCVYVQGYRTTTEWNYFVLRTAGGYDQATAPFYNDNHSSAIVIEETEYPNMVKLNTASGIDGIERIGTWSAPFPTLVPEGVKAYYVTSAGTEENGSSVAYTIQVPDGQAIPGNTGVLLTSTDASVASATMVPAAAEELATIRTNLLGNSAGATKEIPAEEYAYILTGKQNTEGNTVVGFYRLSATNRTLAMNKSYLIAPTGATGEVASFSLKMGFGDETAISGVAAEAHESDAPVYDLFGRRVTSPARSGIYIRNGKKFTVK
ncbi:MAG: hypothetical protein NC388_10090 [Clostridium sp.]|nr:hypothetical protein [Clostridium sp.]